MLFSDYLRSCREAHEMTQEELVSALYSFDDETFGWLNTPTLSRWENGLAKTSMKRMSGILAYFQSLEGLPLPCVDVHDPLEAEALICEEKIGSLFRPKSMVGRVGLPQQPDSTFDVSALRHHPRAASLLSLAELLLAGTTTPYTRVSKEKLSEWMEHPGSLFVTVNYEDSFLGLLFALRLRPESFDEVMAFRKRKEEIALEELAPPGEEGSVYLLAFFALSSEIATLLFRSLFAYVIAYQRQTLDFGFVSSFDEAQRLGIDLGLRRSSTLEDEGKEIVAYRAGLMKLMRSEAALRVLFPRGGCSR